MPSLVLYAVRASALVLLTATFVVGAEQLTKQGALPGKIVESSGLARRPSGTYLTHSDSGGKPELYEIKDSGELVRRWEIPGAKHRDWEAIAVDDRGRAFICDCGNNLSGRRDLKIYLFDFDSPEKLSEIAFSYADQREFPPRNKNLCFDVEACIWRDKHLYLFTKDRVHSRASKVYRLQADGPAQQTAKLLGEIAIDGQVTDAALSPKGDRLVLLSYGKLFLASLKDGDIVGARFEKHKLSNTGQTEAVTFIDDQHLLISNEAGQLFRYQLP